MKKRILCLLLGSALIFSGCAKKEEQQTTKEIAVTGKTEATYDKIELPLPDFLMTENILGNDYIGDSFEGFVADPGGKPAMYYCTYTREYEEYTAVITRCQLNEENDWETDYLCEESLSRFFNNKFEQNEWTVCSLDSFRRGDNGSLYGVFTYYMKETVVEEEQEKEQIVPKYSLLELDEENDSVFEIPLLDLAGKPVERGFGNGWENDISLISDYHVFEDGNVLIVSDDNGGGMASLVDGENGKEIQNLGSIISGKTRFAFGENEIILYSKAENMFQVLSLPDLEVQNQLGTSLTEEERTGDWYFYVNQDTWELYLFNKEGIYQAADYQNGDEVELLTKRADLSDLTGETSTVRDFFVDGEGGFYVCMMETTQEYETETTSLRMLYYQKGAGN